MPIKSAGELTGEGGFINLRHPCFLWRCGAPVGASRSRTCAASVPLCLGIQRDFSGLQILSSPHPQNVSKHSSPPTPNSCFHPPPPLAAAAAATWSSPPQELRLDFESLSFLLEIDISWGLISGGERRAHSFTRSDTKSCKAPGWGSERNEAKARLRALMKKRGSAFIPLSSLLSLQLAHQNKPFIYLFSSLAASHASQSCMLG